MIRFLKLLLSKTLEYFQGNLFQFLSFTWNIDNNILAVVFPWLSMVAQLLLVTWGCQMEKVVWFLFAF
jgi:hypothetical protein